MQIRRGQDNSKREGSIEDQKPPGRRERLVSIFRGVRRILSAGQKQMNLDRKVIMPTWIFRRIASIPPIALVSIVSLLVVLFGPTTIGAAPVIERQPILIDYAEDTALCRSLIYAYTDLDDHFYTHYYLIPPPGVTEDSLFDYDQPPGENSSFSSLWHYRRGRFDFDNDGVTDLVIGVRESFRSFGGDRYFIFHNTPKPGADLPEEEQPPYEPWPDDFGLEWLSTHSRYVFPDMWGDYGTYTLRHQKSKHPTKYELANLYSRPFLFRGVTYLLLVPNGVTPLGALLRPKPNKAVEEACVFRRKPAAK